ncbi:MAG: hypothetical protein PHW24_04920 [Candidatus Moranbacteria bacterium]|nr:hypothetical protein [Candidatus Moranbacteria bacterium]
MTKQEIKGVRWERKVNDIGLFSTWDTGNLIIFTGEDVQPEEIIKNTYLKIIRVKEDGQMDQYCRAISILLHDRFHPKSDEEIFKEATGKGTITLPMPIMPKDGDKIFLFHPENGKLQGEIFQVIVTN